MKRSTKWLIGATIGLAVLVCVCLAANWVAKLRVVAELQEAGATVRFEWQPHATLTRGPVVHVSLRDALAAESLLKNRHAFPAIESILYDHSIDAETVALLRAAWPEASVRLDIGSIFRHVTSIELRPVELAHASASDRPVGG